MILSIKPLENSSTLMINLKLVIENPWAGNKFKSLYVRSKKLSQFKCIEFQVLRYQKTLIEAELTISTKNTRDHHGICVLLGIFGYSCSLTFYDVRHSIPY